MSSDYTPRGGDLVRRHRLTARLWHWSNALIRNPVIFALRTARE